MTPDKRLAEQFLTLLDEEAIAFTFQTFDDNKARKDPGLARVFNGPLDQHWTELVALSRRGAGVFVTVNETDLLGRKAENIVSVRAIFQEADRAGLPLPGLDPHIVVESSPGKFHRYWLVDKWTDFIRFHGCMRRMVEDFGSDPNAADLARVLRLPGFPHQKRADAPHMVRTVETSAILPYSWEALAAAIQPMEERVGINADAIRSLPGLRISEPLKIHSALAVLDPDCEYKHWLTVGMALHHGSGGGGDGFTIWDDWSAKGSSYRNGETAYRWKSFGRYKGSPATISSLFHLAIQAGWKWETHCHELMPQVNIVLEKTLTEAGEHPESVWSPQFVEAMQILRNIDPTSYEQARIRLKNANRRIRLGELDRLTRVHAADDERASLATELVELAEARCEFWHDKDGIAYATFERDGHDEHWCLDSTGFYEWLGWLAYSTLEKTPSRDVLATVINSLSGMAKFEGEEHQVFLRTAGSGGNYWLDLCDESWRAIHISAEGWSVVAATPIRFIRTKAMRPLPYPVVGGDLDKLWDFLNLDEGDRPMLIAWMMESLRPDTPYPIAEFVGEQGTAKSASQRKLLTLLDPNQVPLRAAPKQREDIFVAARNNAIVSFENLSSLTRMFHKFPLPTLAPGCLRII